MELRISSLLALSLAMGCVLIAAFEPGLALPYGFAAASLVVSLRVFRTTSDFGFLSVLLAGSLGLTYFVRPVVLAEIPGLFMYPALGRVSVQELRSALIHIGFFIPPLLGGTALGLGLANRRRGIPKPRGEGKSMLLRGRLMVDALLIATLVAKAVLTVGYSVGVRGVESQTQFGFLLRLVPETIAYPVLALYLLKYRKELSRRTLAWYMTALGALSVLVLMQGSRAFFYQILVVVALFYLARWGDFRIRLARALSIGATAAVFLVLSYVGGTAVRELVRGRIALQDLGSFSVPRVESGSVPKMVWFAGLQATRRLQGFDGVLAVRIHRPPEVVRMYRPKAFAQRLVARLTPLSVASGTYSVGKAVSVYYSNLSFNVNTAGSLGLFATMDLMMGRWGGMVGLLLLGAFVGLMLRISSRIESDDLRFVVEYLTGYHLLWLVMSGNIDNIGARYIGALAQLVVLSLALRSAVGLLGSGATSERFIAVVPKLEDGRVASGAVPIPEHVRIEREEFFRDDADVVVTDEEGPEDGTV